MAPKRAIRIGNASGAIGDGLDQVYRLARDGNVDAITADYLAEFNLAWKAIEVCLQTARAIYILLTRSQMIDRPDLGYEPHFLAQLAWGNGSAARLIAQKKIKIVHDGGALNPEGLADQVVKYLQTQNIDSLRVAWVSGDNVTELIRRREYGRFPHLDVEEKFIDGNDDSILAANVYTGQAGIVAALQAGADIVICGRCCDASPVMGLASWWHGWKSDEYDKLAGSLMAGHIIECGAYATGGNYCGAREISKQYRVGYPIAEIEANGESTITKPINSNGAVTVDTVKAQFLYEIQGSRYLNPDVIARIDHASLEEVGPDRILMKGVTGLAPPPTAKLAVFTRGGFQAELAAFLVGLQIEDKFTMLKTQILRELDPTDYLTLDITPYGSVPTNPKSQAEATVMVRLFVQARTKEAIEKFRHAIFYNGMQGYCGLHLAMDWRTTEPKLFVKYFPALIDQQNLGLNVHFIDSPASQILRVPTLTKVGNTFTGQESYETPNPVDLSACGPIVQRPLGTKRISKLFHHMVNIY